MGAAEVGATVICALLVFVLWSCLWPRNVQDHRAGSCEPCGRDLPLFWRLVKYGECCPKREWDGGVEYDRDLHGPRPFRSADVAEPAAKAAAQMGGAAAAAKEEEEVAQGEPADVEQLVAKAPVEAGDRVLVPVSAAARGGGSRPDGPTTLAELQLQLRRYQITDAEFEAAKSLLPTGAAAP